MSSVNLYFDGRKLNKKSQAPVIVIIRHNKSMATLSTGISINPEQWDGERIINHPNAKVLNNIISRKKTEVETEVLKLELSNELSRCSASDIKKIISPKNEEGKVQVSKQRCFIDVFREFYNIGKSEGTKKIYRTLENHLHKFDSEIEIRTFDDITKSWILSFESYLAKTLTKNGRNIYLRSLRAVCNYAIDNEITTSYPFRRYNMKSEETRKRRIIDIFGW